jgi:hypothetical protein
VERADDAANGDAKGDALAQSDPEIQSLLPCLRAKSC